MLAINLKHCLDRRQDLVSTQTLAPLWRLKWSWHHDRSIKIYQPTAQRAISRWELTSLVVICAFSEKLWRHFT